MIYDNIGNSINVILINKRIPQRSRPDLDNPILYAIWLEVIIGGYRQWSLPKCIDVNKTSNRKINQIARLYIIIANLKKKKKLLMRTKM